MHLAWTHETIIVYLCYFSLWININFGKLRIFGTIVTHKLQTGHIPSNIALVENKMLNLLP